MTMTEPDIRRIAQELVDAQGPTLVAALTGSQDRTLPLQWAENDGQEPAAEFAQRLRVAHRAWARLEQAEGADVARAFFIGGNELLGEQTLLTGIREDREREVEAVVTSQMEYVSELRPSEILTAHRAEALAIVAAAGYSELRVCGTVARGEDEPGDHIDLLADVPSDVGYLAIMGVQAALTDLLPVEVRLMPSPDPETTPSQSMQEILDEAETL